MMARSRSVSSKRSRLPAGFELRFSRETAVKHGLS